MATESEEVVAFVERRVAAQYAAVLAEVVGAGVPTDDEIVTTGREAFKAGYSSCLHDLVTFCGPRPLLNLMQAER